MGIHLLFCEVLLIYIYIYIYISTPPHGQDITLKQFLKRSLTDLILEFSFFLNGCPTEAKETSMPYYLP